MTNIADRARRALRVLLVISPAWLSSTAGAQVQQARALTTEPMLGIGIGSEREALASYLEPRGWRRAIDSLDDVGDPSLFVGRIDGHTAEIVAMFAPYERGGRLENLLINLPVRSEAELRTTFAWAYRRMARRGCTARMGDAYRAQLDSLLAGKTVSIPARDSVPTQPPMIRGHTTVESGNMDWPEAVWPSADGSLGTRLFASVLDPSSPWPYQVTLWSSGLYSSECRQAN